MTSFRRCKSKHIMAFEINLLAAHVRHFELALWEINRQNANSLRQLLGPFSAPAPLITHSRNSYHQEQKNDPPFAFHALFSVVPAVSVIKPRDGVTYGEP